MKEPILEETNRLNIIPYDPKYKKFADLAEYHQSVIWFAHEINLLKDIKDFEQLAEEQKLVLKRIFSFFYFADDLIADNIDENFGSEIKNPEICYFYTVQKFMESIHNVTYGNIAHAIMPDVIHSMKDELMKMPSVHAKMLWIKKWMDASANSFAARLVAFSIIEGIFFCGSFCVIYWFKTDARKILPGIIKSNEFIARDEALHALFACQVYNQLENKLESEQIYQMVQEAMEIESQFIADALPNKLEGINADSMMQYIKFIADRHLNMLQLPALYHAKNPFPWMNIISFPTKFDFFATTDSTYHLNHPNDSIDWENM